MDDSKRSAAGGVRALLLLTVFCTGAAVMIVELTAVRALQPWFGSTTFIWTNVIGVILASLAAGYTVGGRLADRRGTPALLYSLLVPGGACVAAAALLVAPVSAFFLPPAGEMEGVVSLLTWGSLGASMILFAPPTLLLGMISPLAIRLLADGGVGKAAGRVFASSTAGSLAGTYLPAFVLVPHLGSTGALLVAAALILVPAAGGLALSGRPARAAVASGLAAAAGLLLVFGDLAVSRPPPGLAGGGVARVIRQVESAYQFLSVREDHLPDGTVHEILTVNQGVHVYHSFRIRGQVLTGSRYYDDYALLPVLLDLPPGEQLRVALIGLACGIQAAQWWHYWEGPYRLRVSGAEIDPAIVTLGREYFGLPGPDSDWLRIHPVDGRRMLAAARPPDRLFHLIVVDAFANELYLPFHLGTREFMTLCRERLEPGGILALNVAALRSDSPNLVALGDTLATVFGQSLRVRQHYGTNFLLLARKGDAAPDLTRLAPARVRERFGDRPFLREWEELLLLGGRLPARSSLVEPRPGARVLTDDHAPLEWLTDRYLRRFEAEILR